MASLSKNLVEVGVAMVLKDQFTAQSRQFTDHFRRMYSDLRTAAQSTLSFHQPEIQLLSTLKDTGLKAYQTFAQAADDVYLTTAMAGGGMEAYRDLLREARNLNLEVPLTTGDITSAQKFMAMAGMSLEQINAMSDPVAKLASIFSLQAGGKGGVADTLTNIMATFRLASSEAKPLADDLYTAVTSSNMSLQDLGNAIKYAGSEAMASGLNIQETAAAIGLLGDMGIQGSSAGTALANSLRYFRLSLSGQKEKGKQALDALGLSKKDFLDAKGNLVSLHNMYTTVAEAIVKRGLKNDEIATAFYNIFGVRGSRNMVPVIQALAEGTDKMAVILEKMQGNEGAVDQTMAKRLDTAAGQLDLMKSNWDAWYINMGISLDKVVTPLLKVLNAGFKFLNTISDNPFGQFLIRGGFLIGARLAFNLFGRMAKTFQMMFLTLQSGAQGVAAGGASFRRQLEISRTIMTELVGMSQLLAQGAKKIPLGMMNGAPMYLAQGSKGMYLSYMKENGKRGRVTGTQNIHSFMMAGVGGPGGSQASKAAQAAQAAAKSPKGWSRFLGAGMGGAIARSGIVTAAKTVGKGLLNAIPVVGQAAFIGWMLYDVGSLLYGAISGNTEEQKAQRAQREMEKQQEAMQKKAIIDRMSATEFYKYQQLGILREVVESMMRGYSNGVPVNLTINGAEVGKIASEQAIDVTSQALGAYSDTVAGHLADRGYVA